VEVKRGDVVTVALSGDYGKPRPAVVIQIDLFQNLDSTVVLPMTSDLRAMPEFRIDVEPASANGLRVPSQVMIDKPAALPRAKIGKRIGTLDRATLVEIDRRLAVFLGIAK
jgi:mRNA interferase MazF